MAAWGPAAGDFPSAGFPQDTPAPASAPRSRWSWAGGSRAFPGTPAGPGPQSPRDLLARLNTVHWALGPGQGGEATDFAEGPRRMGRGTCPSPTSHTLTGGGTGSPSRPAGEQTPQRSVQSPRVPGRPSCVCCSSPVPRGLRGEPPCRAQPRAPRPGNPAPSQAPALGGQAWAQTPPVQPAG